MQTHLALRKLSETERPDKDVEALLATAPERRAVLFIHGYSGRPVKTWRQFDQLLPGCGDCANRDLFFYGYDGIRADMLASASLFRDFLDRLLTAPADLLNAVLPASAKRPASFGYDEIAIVAHSLGAVISRRALLDATRLGRPWAPRTRLILFAPAHCGASVADLALETASGLPLLSFFVSAARFTSPLIDQLRPDSAELKALREDTLAAAAAHPHLVARSVFIAEYEKIVRNETFALDPPPVAIAGTNHTDICKPSADNRKPLELLVKAL
jgi:alpha-beta hydrolase superfamily lysophospholipase